MILARYSLPTPTANPISSYFAQLGLDASGSSAPISGAHDAWLSGLSALPLPYQQQNLDNQLGELMSRYIQGAATQGRDIESDFAARGFGSNSPAALAMQQQLMGNARASAMSEQNRARMAAALANSQFGLQRQQTGLEAALQLAQMQQQAANSRMQLAASLRGQDFDQGNAMADNVFRVMQLNQQSIADANQYKQLPVYQKDGYGNYYNTGQTQRTTAGDSRTFLGTPGTFGGGTGTHRFGGGYRRF